MFLNYRFVLIDQRHSTSYKAEQNADIINVSHVLIIGSIENLSIESNYAKQAFPGKWKVSRLQ